MEYTTIKNGKAVKVYDLDKCLEAIKIRDLDNCKEIERLREENAKLKDEKYKDEELKKMKSELEQMREEYYRGFAISKEEEKAIESWKKKHEQERHGLLKKELKIKSSGTIGGIYKYIFTPTSIGEVGEIKCACGEKFCFRELM